MNKPPRLPVHEASLTIRLAGRHEMAAETVHGLIQVTMPGAVITLADKQAVHGLFIAWAEAAATASRLGLHDRPHLRYKKPAQRVIAAVLVTGKQPRATILGRAAASSPSGAGQMVVRVGRLTFVCDDLVSWEGQHKLWRSAYEIGTRLWPLPKIGVVASAAERRAIAARVQDTTE